MLITSSPYLQKIKCWLFALPTGKLIALGLIGSYAAAFPLLLAGFFMKSGQSLPGPNLGKHDVTKMIVLGCIAAPLIETAVNQWGCLRLLKKLRCKTGIAIGISALLFGLGHNYSGPYVIFGILAGVVLATVFVIEDARNGRPFLATLAVHVLRNGITAVIMLFVL
jgi:membrane protease YdiL (CAAX protease family)